MKVALIDNGSLEPAAHRNLRALAAAMAERTGIPVAAVSWKHSDRIAAEALGGEPAWTLDRWVRDQVAHGERHFIFVPFFISPQGAIGSALRTDLEKLAQTLRTAGSSDATGRDFSPLAWCGFTRIRVHLYRRLGTRVDGYPRRPNPRGDSDPQP